MKIGIGYYSMQSTLLYRVPHAQLYAEMLDQIVMAEEMGFENVSLTEHHMLDDGYCPSLMVTAGAIAARTKKLRIATAILLLPLHDPIRVAEDVAVVDNISNGRFIMGLGLGYRQEEFDLFGRTMKQRRGRLEEGIEVLQRAWRDEAFDFEGKYYQYNNVNITPKPVQNKIPFWIGAFAPAAIERAARVGASLFIPAIGTLGVIKKQYELHAFYLKKYNRNPVDFERPLVRDIYVSREGKEKAWEAFKDTVVYSLKDYARWGSLVDYDGNLIRDPNDPVIDRIGYDQTIVGTPEECIETILEYKEQALIDPLICRFSTPGMPHEMAMASMRLFADEVMPHIQ